MTTAGGRSMVLEVTPAERDLLWEALCRELQRAPAQDPRRAPLAALLVRVRDQPTTTP